MLPDGSIFEFQTMMQTVLNGMAGNMIPAIQTVSYVLMVICLLLGIYEAYARGGDTRQLAATVFKYVVVAFVVGNWTTFFTDLMNGFNGIAQFIDNSYGAGDLMVDWGKQLSSNWNNSGYTSIWNIITSGGAAIVNSLEIMLAYLIFPLAVQIFTLIYIFWGAVVFAVGPLVLALAPSRMVNSVAKFYMQNLVVWNCWTVVYAIFACLITAVNGKSMTTSPFFANSITGAQTQIWIGLTSIIYSICILIIPLIAFFVLKAEFGGVAGALGGLVATVNQATRLASVGAGKGRASSGSSQGNQGGMGGGAYRNLSRPPDDTPARATTA
ncbi:MAG: hypothetical protein WCE63_24125 [Acidobacteriaceae bacterium]